MSDQLVKVRTAKLAKEVKFNLNSPAFFGCDDPHNGPANRFMMRDWIKFSELGTIDSQEGTLIYSDPTQTMLNKWIRDNYKILVIVDVDPDEFNGLLNYYPEIKDLSVDKEGLRLLPKRSYHQEYEEALEEGLYEALKIIIKRNTASC